MPRPTAELWCASAELAPELRRALDARGLRVRRVAALPGGSSPALPSPARGANVLAIVLEAAPGAMTLDAIAAAARSARAAAVVAALGTGPSQAPVSRALAARRGLAFATDLETLVEVAAVLAGQGAPRGPRTLVVARSAVAAREMTAAADRAGLALEPPGPALAGITSIETRIAVSGRAPAAATRRAIARDDRHDVVVWWARRAATGRPAPGLIELEASVAGAANARGTIVGAERIVAVLSCLQAVAGRAPAPAASPEATAAGSRKKPPPVADREETLAVLDGPARALSDPSSKRALAPYRIPFVREVLCTSPTGAARAAVELQTPLVAKVASPDLPIGAEGPGVVRGIPNAPQARAAYHAALRSAGAGRRILGVRFAEETAGLASLRVRIDRVEGSLVLRVGGHGPIGALAPDLALALPAGRDDLACFVDALPWRVLWEPGKDRPGGDRAGLIELLARTCGFAEDLVTRVSQVVLDPVMVRPKGQGAVAVDARVTVG